MKKLPTIIIALIVMSISFTGCSKNDPAPSIAPENHSQEVSTITPPESSKPETSSPNETNNTPFSQMPSSFTGTEKPSFYEISGALGANPGEIVKTFETNEFNFTISVPIIPNDLKEFAESRGENYFLLYCESKTSSANGAILAFYSEPMQLMYLNTVGDFDVSFFSYVFISSNGAFIIREEPLVACFIADPGSVSATIYADFGSETELDLFASTSMAPSEEHIHALMAALS
ncbi:MAG: hypothetical protein LBT19_00360 [Candidatus Nomurabacteria bacterium]|jgi:hypothetical protein|nr:hypothetical protein [Candidatus Nomurabacteria bacterium]